MIRTVLAVTFLWLTTLGAWAQDNPTPDRSATGGAQTLADIMARQDAMKLDDRFRSENLGDPESAADITQQLGTLGGQSDPDLWRALRYDAADVTTQSRGPAATTLIQDGGMQWLAFREGRLLRWGGYLLLGTLALLGVFYLIRGRIRIDGEKTGRTITRFKAIERFGHWLMAGSFVVLALTGLISLFGRKFVIPLLGHESFAVIALGAKWVHNNISWAFMIGLVMVFFMWVLENIPNRHDLKWVAVGGGLMKKGVHPPAKKFNAGQKVVFWSVILLGGSISISGLSLLFPFELPMFAKTFSHLNDLGITGLIGMDPLPAQLTPQEEMQFAQAWHAIVGFVLMAIIIAHIYIGSVGMEGAFDAMGSGEVEEQWAREHHSLWVDEVKAKNANQSATPAE
ncbi:formate dehydrogenase subunit gamma [Loktanella sp. S4079]|uniref:formate dehydrogenase subunit gamma n=1 Tax=Loktanella sp. S4079 TaxID=579483 RepID=UPI00061F3364|nr:formate dehydrogenase subunit gamma [Loktanella sp. S4079]KJZ20448.1 formate dehydrogenase [Loktanella sp. S4079]